MKSSCHLHSFWAKLNIKDFLPLFSGQWSKAFCIRITQRMDLAENLWSGNRFLLVQYFKNMYILKTFFCYFMLYLIMISDFDKNTRQSSLARLIFVAITWIITASFSSWDSRWDCWKESRWDYQSQMRKWTNCHQLNCSHSSCRSQSTRHYRWSSHSREHSLPLLS